MSTIIVKRPSRRAAPELPSGDVILDPPPELPQPGNRAWTNLLVTLPMIAGSAAMALAFSFQRPGPLGYLTGGMFGISMLGIVAMQIVTQAGQPSKQELMAARREYMRHLAQHRRRIRRTITQQREAMHYRHPEPDALWSTAASLRLWERRPGDGDFGVIRIGIGPQEVATPLLPPETRPLDDLEPMSALALRRFLKTYTIVPDLPVAASLRGFARIYLRGPSEQSTALVRAMLAQVATFHAPEDMLIAVCCSQQRRGEWEWAKWLPHALHPAKLDALGQLRLVTHTVTALEAMLEDVIATRPRYSPTSPAIDGPHVVVVLDGGDVAGSDHLATEGGVEGVTIIDMSNRPPRALDRSMLVLDIDSRSQLHSATMESRDKVGRPDNLGVVEAESLARQLAPLRLSATSRGDQPLSAELGLVELLELGDPFEFDPARTWIPRPNRDRLRVPFGLGTEGLPVELDIKESAQDGMGPHGLLVGATGSGKSELLRTLTLGLAISHNSETLNFVLVDFKGGATFTKLDRLPHTSAVITNLEEELALVDRMQDAIQGELVRRQELLRKAGNFASQRDYERARAAGAPLAPLPSLLLICDEFSELLTAKPDFIDMFVQIGRVGRSLGVHLLLASQRLEEGRLRGLDTHLSYRIGLRTFSAMESRVVLGVSDAYELPRSPGHGYMKYGTEPMTRFKAAYVSGTFRRSASAPRAVLDSMTDPILDYSTQYLAPRHEEDTKPAAGADSVDDDDEAMGDSVLDILVARIEGRGTPAHQVWLPPLAEPPTLDQMLPPLTTEPDRGLTVSHPDLRGKLQVPVGIVDRPFDQRRDLLWVDFAGAGGHMVVIGGPQSGKSTLLRCLVGALALTHTPQEVQIFCLDFGGGALTGLRNLPHVGGVATRLDTNVLRRTVAEVAGLMRDRERMFNDLGVDSIATYRRRKAAGEFADDPFGDVFLVVDGYLTLRNEFEDLELTLVDIANRGLTYGIHIVASGNRWMDIRMALRDLFGTRLELRLGDPSDSSINRRTAMNVPEASPGRGLTPEALHFLSGLPRIDGRQGVEDLGEGVAKFVQTMRNAWSGTDSPAVRLLPDEVPYEEMPKPDEDRRPGLPIGIAELDLQPVYLDVTSEPHFLLFGDSECGKSAFLRTYARAVMDRYGPEQAKIMVIDYRRSLLGVVPPEYQLAYGTSSAVTGGMVDSIAEAMRRRLPGPDVTAAQLRGRSWWTGPELFVLVDDYDLVATGPQNPLAKLLDYLAQARDIGLHLVTTRRAGGAGRALYDPVLGRLRELASPGMIMSGPKDEGALLGNIKPQFLPPGRGWLVTRREGAQLIQVAWAQPPA